MRKKLTITVDEEVYMALHKVIGKRRISSFIESLVKPRLITEEIERGYQEMAKDTLREEEAKEWLEEFADELTDV